MMGFEVELDRRITAADGSKIDGDKKLALFDGFRLVTDARLARQKAGTAVTTYPNVELVSTPPFDELSSPSPVAGLLTSMRALADAFYVVAKPTTLADVLAKSGLRHHLTAIGAAAIVDPSAEFTRREEVPKKKPTDPTTWIDVTYGVRDLGVDNLFVHYTVGIPAGRLRAAVRGFTDAARDQDLPCKPNAERALQAGDAAAELYSRWAKYRVVLIGDADRAALAGFVAVVYTQLAAITDHSYKRGKAQIKNRTVLLCRVPLREVANVLPASARQFLAEQAWVDLRNEDDSLPVLTEFIADRTEKAAKYLAEKEAAATAARLGLESVLKRLAATDPSDRVTLDALEEERQEHLDIIADYDGAHAGLREWQSMSPVPKEVSLLDAERPDRFLWSVIDQALVPALEGRRLAASLATKPLDGLFEAGTADAVLTGPDGGPKSDLSTGMLSEMAEPVTLGEYLFSAFLAPGHRPIGPERLFGGMAEVPKPDAVVIEGKPYQLIPVELRAHGPQFVSWVQLGASIKQLADFSRTLL